ncbi:MAG: hypothetical protein RBR86_04750 [Pseudobdellovibrionaceae bacterium]|nr:hypothetical protein [Pseudobdellovibrionaceae bacterium]
MADIRKNFGWAVLLSELSHVFCCVLPTLVTVMGVLANAGLMGAAPGVLMDLHETIHHYEIPLIIFSGVMVALGWIIHLASTDVDCHDTGCAHPPCSPKKRNNSRILVIATVLFAVNLLIYGGVHQNVFHLEVFEAAGTHTHE